MAHHESFEDGDTKAACAVLKAACSYGATVGLFPLADI
jgi:hypothetical protein